MSEYEIFNNYILFKELGSDSIGTNFRGGEIEDRKAAMHNLLTEVHPFLSGNLEASEQINSLLETIRKANIPNLYCPDKIIREGERAFHIYPLIKGRTLKEILEDSAKKDIPIDFDLAFSIAIAIADLIDNASSVYVEDRKSFHGFLTPDNIIIDFDGKILLKNYGIFPFLEKSEDIFTEIVKKYDTWLAPEFLRKEELMLQSDIYHLGYIIYRILTGEDFHHTSGEDFDAKFKDITFAQYIPSSEDRDFMANITTFFKKTLNPDPAKRFANMKEFKDFVSQYFNIEELSSVTFVLAYFVNSLYLETVEEENNRLAEELAYSIPEEEEVKSSEELEERILAGLEYQRSSRTKMLIGLVAVIVVLIAVGIFYINYTKKKSEQEQRAAIEKMELEKKATIQKLESRLAELQKQQDLERQKFEEQMNSLEKQETTTEEEKEAKKQEIERLKKLREEQERREQERIDKEWEALRKQLEEERQRRIEAEEAIEARRKRIEQERKKQEELAKLQLQKEKPTETVTPKTTPTPTTPTVKVGELVALDDVTYSPNKLSGKSRYKPDELNFPNEIKKKYQGQTLTVDANVLINEKGDVTQVKIEENLPKEIKSEIAKILTEWKYVAAEKDKVKVKVWYPVKFKVPFGGERPVIGKKKEAEKVEEVVEVVPLKSVTYSPQKLSGTSKLTASGLRLSKSLRRKYSGQTLTIKSEILIDDKGQVEKVRIEKDIPNEIKVKVYKVLVDWKYVPAEKNKIKVKVWNPVELTVAFEGKPKKEEKKVEEKVEEKEEKKVEEKEKPTPKPEAKEPENIVNLKEVTYSPNKLSGSSRLTADDLKISRDLRKKYKGKVLTVEGSVLIDEKGNVIRVRIDKDLEREIKIKVSKDLIKWTFVAAEKNKVKVKVWYPFKVTVSFK